MTSYSVSPLITSHWILLNGESAQTDLVHWAAEDLKDLTNHEAQNWNSFMIPASCKMLGMAFDDVMNVS